LLQIAFLLNKNYEEKFLIEHKKFLVAYRCTITKICRKFRVHLKKKETKNRRKNNKRIIGKLLPDFPIFELYSEQFPPV